MPNLSSLTKEFSFLNSQNASGTAVNFTGIPSWARRITVYFDGVRSNGTASRLVQLGTSSGYVATGYLSYWFYAATPSFVGGSNSTAGFGLWNGGSNDINYATMTITNIGNNNWVESHEGAFWNSASPFGTTGGGRITMSGVVDRVRIINVGGTESFTAGTFGLSYE